MYYSETGRYYIFYDLNKNDKFYPLHNKNIFRVMFNK